MDTMDPASVTLNSFCRPPRRVSAGRYDTIEERRAKVVSIDFPDRFEEEDTRKRRRRASKRAWK